MDLLKRFFKFVIPSIVSMWIFSLYTMVDGIFVAWGVGEHALTAVNLSMPFTSLVFMVGILLATGTSTVISIALGQGDLDRARNYFNQNLFVTGIASLLLGALELGAAGLLAGVGRLASFTDVAFGLGVATLLFGLLLLLGGRHRVQAGMGTVNLFSPTASTAFQAQVSYDEAKTAKMPAQPLDGFLVKLLAVFVAAAVVLAGFGVSLLF